MHCLIIASLITGLVGGAVWLQAHLLQSEAVTSYARLRGVGVLNREYGFLAEMLFGPKGRSVITTMIGIQFLLTLIANMVALAEAGSLLFRIANGYCVLVFAVLSFALSVVPIYEHITRVCAIVTPVALTIGLIGLIIASIARLTEEDQSSLPMIPFYSPAGGVGDFFVLLGVVVFSFSNAFSLPAYGGIVSGPSVKGGSPVRPSSPADTVASAATEESQTMEKSVAVGHSGRRRYFERCLAAALGCSFLYMSVVGVLGMHLCGDSACPPNYLTLLERDQTVLYGAFVLVYLVYIAYSLVAIPVLMTPLMAVTEATVVRTASVKLRVLWRGLVTVVVCGLAVALQNHLPQLYAVTGCAITIALVFIVPLGFYLLVMRTGSSAVVAGLYVGIIVASAAAILGTVFSALNYLRSAVCQGRTGGDTFVVVETQ
ncbi:hypothetical protein FOZ63_010911 [Perkinsus olseni]|uniref:Solute carrier 38 member n=1 Tax=Perkinsus olseni TaxID=32597 RepID=A0A7J6R6U5_PEROL|nr:hypothetical protein FOZ63_010911 [Perkinsus olseni]